MDLSQSAADCKTSSNTISVNTSQVYHQLYCSVSAPVDELGASKNLMPDVRSMQGCLANFNTMLKTDTFSVEPVLPVAKISAEYNDANVQYPKTKKQRAVNSKATSLTSSLPPPALDRNVSEYEALTFGEIQERLITKVVESGSLSGVLFDERRHAISSSNRQLTNDKFPSQLLETSQYRPRVASETTSSEQCEGSLLTTSSSSSFSTKQKSVAAASQGLWL